MIERPILFQGDMVRAILEGRKTQTRRIVKPQPDADITEIHHADGDLWLTYIKQKYGQEGEIRCPYQAGYRLWVREAFALVGGGDPGIPLYRATWQEDAKQHRMENADKAPRWTPSIHMPRWASRITLEITDVRVERLTSITKADAEAEGVAPWRDEKIAHVAMYRELWESINGAGNWDLNPWVWVVEFRRLQK